MSIEVYYDATSSTKRLSDIASTDNEEYGTSITTFNCHIQPLEDSFREDLEGSYGKDYLLFCAVQDIKEGDIVVNGSTEYLVKGIKSYSFGGQSHMEITLRKTR